MLRQARIAELEAELAHLKCEISDNSITNIKKLYYNTYGERHYDITGWNTNVLDGTICHTTGRGDNRPDEYFTLILETTNLIIRFMYSSTECHEMQTYSISILTDKALYSHKIAQKENAAVWSRIRRVKDIPEICNDFERDILITFAHIAPDPSFFTARYKSIELPVTTKFKPYKKMPKGTFNNLKEDAAPIYPGEESTDEECNLIAELI